MATEIINITVYGSTGAIDASLSPIISIYNLSRSAFDVNSAVVPYNATILSYQYFFTDYNPLYEYIANVDF